MGGRGSGRYGGRAMVESSYRLDIGRLVRAGAIGVCVRGEMELGGRRIIERVLGVVRAVVDDVLVVTNTPELYRFLGLPMVPDVFPDHGSLGGLYSGLAAARGGAAFTVACDMPFLRVDVARLVVERAPEADVVIPRVGERWRPCTPSTARPVWGPWKTACARAGSRSSDSSRTSASSSSARPRSRGTPIPPSCS